MHFAREMVEARPAAPGQQAGNLVACVEACLDREQACSTCVDACDVGEGPCGQLLAATPAA